MEGEGPRGATVAVLAAGQVLAGRYRLDEHLVDSTTGRALWRATDLLLARGVAVEVQSTVGADSQQLLDTAMAISRVRHPAIVAIYDAVEETDRAYVVREWAAGGPLRKLLANGPLEAHQAITIARSAAEGLAALHSAGAAHGNLTPTTVIVNSNFECTMTDLTLAESAEPAADVRAVGALLYAALTARWPSANGNTPEGMVPATRLDGRLCTPRQIRAGVPHKLDALAMELLDNERPAPAAHDLASQLNQLEYASELRQREGLTGQLPLAEPLNKLRESRIRRIPLWAKLGIPICVMLVFLAILAVLVLRTPTGDGSTPPANATNPSSAAPALHVIQPKDVEIDDPQGDNTENKGASKAIDGDRTTKWKTATYKGQSNFGGLKKGMGVRVSYGTAQTIKQVDAYLDPAGATAVLYVGNDIDELHDRPVVQPTSTNGGHLTFQLNGKYKYVLLWITNLPPYETGYGVGVQEIEARG
ncbi:protein kinase family protein [Fodinicola acaciae]|uniref:protein kinase family protein n=1 Tax=Fodinicola acaciae TaxID=2681555 RepID=UPI0013D4FE31|nr:protein kinase family protein [Fodinicola acaciae]